MRLLLLLYRSLSRDGYFTPPTRFRFSPCSPPPPPPPPPPPQLRRTLRLSFCRNPTHSPRFRLRRGPARLHSFVALAVPPTKTSWSTASNASTTTLLCRCSRAVERTGLLPHRRPPLAIVVAGFMTRNDRPALLVRARSRVPMRRWCWRRMRQREITANSKPVTLHPTPPQSKVRHQYLPA
mgnify:CR=1 FL=1